MERILKIILAILLFACLFSFPYGYYEFVRFLSFVLFGYFAFDEYKKGNQLKAFIYVALAILFQPLLKISLGRIIWNIVDVLVAIWLIVEAKTSENTIHRENKELIKIEADRGIQINPKRPFPIKKILLFLFGTLFIFLLGHCIYKGVEGTELREDIDYNLGIKEPLQDSTFVAANDSATVVDSAEIQLQAKLDKLKQKYPYPAPNESSNIETEKKYSFVVLETEDKYHSDRTGYITTGVFETTAFMSEDEEYRLLDEATSKAETYLILRNITKRELKSYDSYAEASKAREKYITNTN